MRRGLFQTVKVIPYTSGAAIDREGFLSAIFAANVTAGDTMTLKLTHCDTEDGEYTDVTDDYVGLGSPLTMAVSTGALMNQDIDLLGCKRFVKIAVTLTGTNAAATYSVALGDSSQNPV